MKQRWSVLFRQFSLSVDSVDDQTIDRAKEVLEDYLVEQLGTSFFRVVVDGNWIKSGAFDIPALETIWTSGDRKLPTVPTWEEGETTSQIAVAYLSRRPLWIVGSEGERLADVARAEGAFSDIWSHTEDLPPYSDHGDSVARTSVLMPLEYGSRVFGVLDMQFDDVVPITDRGRKSLRLVASSLARLLWLNETHNTRNSDTFRAFQELEEDHQLAQSPLKMREVFLSTSESGDSEVIDIMLSVLREFDDLVQVHYWKDDALGGDIKQQVRDALMRCEFGVCYLSEPVEEDEGTAGDGGVLRFADNPNVIFEAGMLQALNETHRDRDVLSRWVPVRETEPFSKPLPFNFATDRVVGVTRDPETGQLDQEEFTADFRAAIQAQVETLGLRT